MVVVGVVALTMVGLVLVMLDPDRRWTPKVHFRPVLVDGALHLERCGAWLGTRRWWCFIDVDSVSEFEFDVDGDQRSDVRALFWDDRRPKRCIDLRPNRRFSALDSASCCCADWLRRLRHGHLRGPRAVSDWPFTSARRRARSTPA